VLILLHRWLGVAFCLLFAMWFASGIVMHFVPFPALTEADRFAGLAPIDLARVAHGPAEAWQASGIKDARIRLMQRSDGPVYLTSDATRVVAVHAVDLSDAAVHSPQLALAIAVNAARRRGLNGGAADVVALKSHDQWTMASAYDRHRPLYRVALNDSLGTELYVSSASGEVVLDTTHSERAWNYIGSIAHWIYPVALRSHAAAWRLSLWWLSLLALLGAAAGAVVGTFRLGADGPSFSSPYRGWQKWHHWLGLFCGLFVVTWIFSGWLSMDDGLLFSTGKPSATETTAINGTAVWTALPPDEVNRLSGPVREVEWFAFDGRIYRRERTAINSQRLFLAAATDASANPDRDFLRDDEIDTAAKHVARTCAAAVVVAPDDSYGIAADMPGAPVFRLVCGTDWFDIDGANGVLLERLDASSRTYRWLYAGLHTLNFPPLMVRPLLRAALIAILCGCGLVFSLTGVVVAWRRVLSCLRSPRRP